MHVYSLRNTCTGMPSQQGTFAVQNSTCNFYAEAYSFAAATSSQLTIGNT